jgi:hypothetical protein
MTDTDHVLREARALNTIRVRFERVYRLPNAYAAHIYIDGDHWGYVSQRPTGEYEAYTAKNRLVASAASLTRLRELVTAALVTGSL